MSTITSITQRLACRDCGRRTRKAYPISERGHVSLLDVPLGWGVAPYPRGYVHPDGSVGDQWFCPRHNRRES